MIRTFPFVPMAITTAKFLSGGAGCLVGLSYEILGSALLVDPVNFPPIHFLNRKGKLTLFSSNFRQFLTRMLIILYSPRSFIYAPESIAFQQVCKAIARTIGCNFLYQRIPGFHFPSQHATRHLYVKQIKICVTQQLETAALLI